MAAMHDSSAIRMPHPPGRGTCLASRSKGVQSTGRSLQKKLHRYTVSKQQKLPHRRQSLRQAETNNETTSLHWKFGSPDLTV